MGSGEVFLSPSWVPVLFGVQTSYPPALEYRQFLVLGTHLAPGVSEHSKGNGAWFWVVLGACECA